MPVIDFRVRPPVRGFLDTLMYSNGARRDAFTRSVGFEPSPAAQTQSMELLLKEMDEAGVTRGVVVGRFAGMLGSVSNDDVAAVVREHPDRFIGIASIDPSDRRRAMDTIRDAMKAGFKAVNIEPGAYPTPLYTDDRRLYPIYALCEDEKVPVVIMTGGTAGPDLSYSNPILIDRVLADFPRLKMMAVHGNWPWVTEILHVAFRRPNFYLSPDMYFSRMPGWEEYVKAADGFLADRTVYASSFPFCPLKDYHAWFTTLPIRPENMERVMHRNALDFLGMESL